MKKVLFKHAVLISFIFFGISVLLFSWQFWHINLKLPIDADRFSKFGSFVGGTFGIFSFILLILTLRNSQKQFTDNTFFNLLQVHDSIVRELKSREIEIRELFEESKKLFENHLCESLSTPELRSECKHYESMGVASEYFNMLYRILHLTFRAFQKYHLSIFV